MSCHAILKNLHESKMDVILTISFKIINRDNKTDVLRPTLQTMTCIGVLKSIIMFFHSFFAMEYALRSVNAAGRQLAIILPAEVSFKRHYFSF